MAIQLQGNGGSVAEVDGTTFRSLRITPRPVDHGALGAYSIGVVTGVLPAVLAANAEIFQFRWTDATRLAVIRKIRISASYGGTFFTPGIPLQIDLVKATGWTGQGTLGTGITMGATLKRRTSMASSLVAAGDMRIATTAALGAGTKTLEANSLSNLVAYAPAAAPGQIIAPGTALWQVEVGDGEHPLVLVQNEGFVIRDVQGPGGGTWVAAITVDWAEVTAY
jgi:hypothetical protein